MCTLSVSNVIYHKFSHGATFYTLNGKNVNVMLEYSITYGQLELSRAFIFQSTSYVKEYTYDAFPIFVFISFPVITYSQLSISQTLIFQSTPHINDNSWDAFHTERNN